MLAACRWTTTFRNSSPGKRAYLEPRSRVRFTGGSIISPTCSSILPLPEPTSTWSDPKTIRARLILDDGFLIDTNVLSEYNRLRGPDAGVKRWLETTDRQS